MKRRYVLKANTVSGAIRQWLASKGCRFTFTLSDARNAAINHPFGNGHVVRMTLHNMVKGGQLIKTGSRMNAVYSKSNYGTR